MTHHTALGGKGSSRSSACILSSSLSALVSLNFFGSFVLSFENGVSTAAFTPKGGC